MSLIQLIRRRRAAQTRSIRRTGPGHYLAQAVVPTSSTQRRAHSQPARGQAARRRALRAFAFRALRRSLRPRSLRADRAH
jgi:hypothetical protein